MNLGGAKMNFWLFFLLFKVWVWNHFLQYLFLWKKRWNPEHPFPAYKVVNPHHKGYNKNQIIFRVGFIILKSTSIHNNLDLL